MTDQSLELRIAAIYTHNLSNTSDLEIWVYECTFKIVPYQLCLHSQAVDDIDMSVCIYTLFKTK